MKIAIPTDYKKMEGKVSDSFGRAIYYLIYDTESEKVEFIENRGAQARGGAGIKAAQEVVDAKVDILITPRCGQNAAEVLQGANIKLYQSISGTLEDNVKSFKADQLTLSEDIHPGYHEH